MADDIVDAFIRGSSLRFGPSSVDFGTSPAHEGSRSHAGGQSRQDGSAPPPQPGPSRCGRGPAREGPPGGAARRHDGEAAYVEHPAVQARTWSEVERWRASHGVLVEDSGGLPLPKPTVAFDEAPFPDWAAEAFRSWGLSAPSPLQAQAWPLVASGRDVLAVAPPGMGRTLAYGVPLLVRALSRPEAEQAVGPAALVLASAPEPGEQACAALEPLAAAAGLRVALLDECGGGGLAGGLALLVATVPCLAAALRSGSLAGRLGCLSALALDDADALLAEGGCPAGDLDRALRLHEGDVQLLFFAASPTKEASEAFGCRSRKGAARLSAAPGAGLGACPKVTHHVEVVHEDAKRRCVDEALQKIAEPIARGARAVVFAPGRAAAQEVSGAACSTGMPAATLHDETGPEERRAALREFREGGARVLVVAPGGVLEGLPHVQFVVNVGCPLPAEYTQRLGRCCAPGQQAWVMTLLAPEDFCHARGLALMLEEAGQPVPAGLRRAAAGLATTIAREAAAAAGGSEDLKPGEWHCVDCRQHQYSWRRACRDCGAARPMLLGAPTPWARSEDLRPGEWHCVDCRRHQYSWRRACRDCGAARPLLLGAPPPWARGARPAALLRH
ncbi:unnamed protein product, partial [Prorocentrum cordatum]